jgi:hypothetical protein
VDNYLEVSTIMITSVPTQGSLFVTKEKEAFKKLAAEQKVQCICNQPLRTNGGAGCPGRDGVRRLQLKCVNQDCDISAQQFGNWLKNKGDVEPYKSTSEELETFYQSLPPRAGVAKNAKKRNRIPLSSSEEESCSEEEDKNELQELRKDFERLMEINQFQQRQIAAFSTFLKFDLEKGEVEFTPRARELLIRDRPDDINIENRRKPDEGDNTAAMVIEEEPNNTGTSKRSYAESVRGPRTFWTKTASSNHLLTEEERAKILRIGQAPAEPENFVRTHVRCANKANSFREKRLQARAFIKALGIRSMIADYSIVGTQLELYVKESRLPEYVKTINDNQIIAEANFQPWQMGEGPEETIAKRKEAASRRLAHLLARANHPQLRSQIMLGYSEELIQVVFTKEAEVRESLDRQPAKVRPIRPRQQPRFKPLALEDFAPRLRKVEEEDLAHRDGVAGQSV